LTLAAATVRRRLTPERDAAVLAPVVRRIARRLRADRLARPVWRVRGDGSAPGSVTVRILPRPGGRLARGVRSIECAVAWTEGTLVWRAVPVLSIRIDRGSPLERTLRTLALTLGTLETDGDDGWVWVADMVGPDRRAVVKALARLMKSAVSPEREAIEVAPRADVVASEALA
jgi:hypothetical protein